MLLAAASVALQVELDPPAVIASVFDATKAEPPPALNALTWQPTDVPPSAVTVT